MINKRNIAALLLFVAAFAISSCAQRMGEINSRPLGMFEKEGSHLMVHGRDGAGGPAVPPEMYIKKRTVKITPLQGDNDTGSLFKSEDGRNYLFLTKTPVEIGSFLSINVNSTQLPKTGGAAKGKDGAASGGGGGVEDAMLAALPDLEPAEKGNPALIKRFRARVAHRYANGDVMIVAQRRSSANARGNETTVKARVPYDRLISGEDISTDDLAEVHFVESKNGEVLDRHSSGWEDEYSLRMSGFDEMKSKLAATLDDKRNQLQEVKSQLANRLQSFGKERRQMTEQREGLLEQKQKDSEEIQDLNGKIEQKDSQIKSQEEQIKQLSSEEKPGDEKDGSEGE